MSRSGGRTTGSDAAPRKAVKSAGATREITGGLAGNDLKIGIVVARFNEYITRQMLDAAVGRLVELGVQRHGITVVWVPGSFELPVVAKKLAGVHDIDAVITLGAVIEGETAHFEHVAHSAAEGILRASLDTGKPVIFGVLTTYDTGQAVARIGHARGYAEAAIEMAGVLGQINSA